MQTQDEAEDGGLRDWRPRPGRGGGRGVRESVGTRWAQPRRAEACLACPRHLRVYLSALERQAREPAGRVGDGADFRQGSCEGRGVRLRDPPLTTPLHPAAARSRPSHHPDGQTPITAENTVLPHTAAALYPLKIENFTFKWQRRFFLNLDLSVHVNLCLPVCHARILCLFANQSLGFHWSV